jgi:hypothetical protein
MTHSLTSQGRMPLLTRCNSQNAVRRRPSFSTGAATGSHAVFKARCTDHLSRPAREASLALFGVRIKAVVSGSEMVSGSGISRSRAGGTVLLTTPARVGGPAPAALWSSFP